MTNDTQTFLCWECGIPVDEDDAVWVDPFTGEATTGESGAPYHVPCAPAQEGEE